MKTDSEFMAQEAEIMNDFAKVLKDRGFKAKWYKNMLGEPTVAVYVVDEDGNEVQFSACFGTADL